MMKFRHATMAAALTCGLMWIAPNVGAQTTTQPATTQPAAAAVDEQNIEGPRGISYRMIQAPAEDAVAPKDGQYIAVHMTMSTHEGRKIQSTRDADRPLIFRFGEATFLDGINVALGTLREGGRSYFVIPPQLAFGDGGTPDGVIAPNTPIHLDIELLEILPDLQITTVEPGEGNAAKAGDFVVVHYTGTIHGGEKDGQKFDSSHDRDTPLTVALGAGQVIPGWEEGITGIKPGEKRTLIVPPHLAYGDRQVGEMIAPNTTLKFEVECMERRDGLTYSVDVEGDGEEAKAGRMVTVHYTGRLSGGERDGEKFDSSLDRGVPFSFPLGVGRVITGWDLGVEGMKVGEKRTLTIPSEWGYGPMGSGNAIPGGATLKFEVELLAVQ